MKRVIIIFFAILFCGGISYSYTIDNFEDGIINEPDNWGNWYPSDGNIDMSVTTQTSTVKEGSKAMKVEFTSTSSGEVWIWKRDVASSPWDKTGWDLCNVITFWVKGSNVSELGFQLTYNKSQDTEKKIYINLGSLQNNIWQNFKIDLTEDSLTLDQIDFSLKSDGNPAKIYIDNIEIKKYSYNLDLQSHQLMYCDYVFLLWDWVNNPSQTVAKYKIYRSTSFLYNLTNVYKEVPGDMKVFTDVNVSKNTYYYVIEAVTSGGNTIDTSPCVKVDRTGTTVASKTNHLTDFNDSSEPSKWSTWVNDSGYIRLESLSEGGDGIVKIKYSDKAWMWKTRGSSEDWSGYDYVSFRIKGDKYVNENIIFQVEYSSSAFDKYAFELNNLTDSWSTYNFRLPRKTDIQTISFYLGSEAEVYLDDIYLYVTDHLPPDQIYDLSATSYAGTTKIKLIWSAVTNDDGVAYYNIYRHTKKIYDITGMTPVYVLNGTVTSYEDIRLQPSNIYYYIVTAVDNSGNEGLLSNLTSGTTYIDTQAPTTPTSLSATVNSNTISVTLNWNASSDNSGVVGYQIYRKYNSETNFYYIGTSSTNHYVDNKVGFDKSCQYKVRAYDYSLNYSSYSSNSASVQLPSAYPVNTTYTLYVSAKSDPLSYVALPPGAVLIPGVVTFEQTLSKDDKSEYSYELSLDYNSRSYEEFFIPVDLYFYYGDKFDSKPAIYYYNGVRWINLGGIEVSGSYVKIKGRNTGLYTLKADDSIDNDEVVLSHIEAPIFTPNNDGENDKVKFYVSNNDKEKLIIKIYNLYGKEIYTGESNNGDGCITWDGYNSENKRVKSGVYIYKIRCGDKEFSGTIVIAR